MPISHSSTSVLYVSLWSNILYGPDTHFFQSARFHSTSSVSIKSALVSSRTSMEEVFDSGLLGGAPTPSLLLDPSIMGESLHCALLLDYVPPEEPPSTPLGKALRIR